MPESAEQSPGRKPLELIVVVAAWFLLFAIVVLLAKQNLSAPGLNYDEAIFAGLAKDFLAGEPHGQHAPDTEVITFLGRPFPVFVQSYLGALKSWMLMPSFAAFGATVPVLRLTTLLWGAIALLFLMAAAREWLGLRSALISGLVLAFDPNYFFLSVLDWGAAVPSFLCRCACLYFAVRWYRRRKVTAAFLAGLFAGLGFFNKADFAILLIGASAAAAVCYWRQLTAAVRAHKSAIFLMALGFVAGAGPMLMKIPRILLVSTLRLPPGEPNEKWLAMGSMFDGSYFHRLMNTGGRFYTMFEAPAGARSGLGIALAIAVGAAVFLKIGKKLTANTERAVRCLILAMTLVALGVMALPGAVRIHHMVLVFPLPHLLIGTVAAACWPVQGINLSRRRLINASLVIVLLALFAGELRVIHKTQRLIRETGGRGWWSESLDRFCRENRTRSDLTIVSLDWGFNEQLIFLTDGPQLSEPFWEFNQTLPPLPPDPNVIYLAHAPHYSVLRYDAAYLNQLQKSGLNVEILPQMDRQNEVAFYTIRFRSQ